MVLWLGQYKRRQVLKNITKGFNGSTICDDHYCQECGVGRSLNYFRVHRTPTVGMVFPVPPSLALTTSKSPNNRDRPRSDQQPYLFFEDVDEKPSTNTNDAKETKTKKQNRALDLRRRLIRATDPHHSIQTQQLTFFAT